MKSFEDYLEDENKKENLKRERDIEFRKRRKQIKEETRQHRMSCLFMLAVVAWMIVIILVILGPIRDKYFGSDDIVEQPPIAVEPIETPSEPIINDVQEEPVVDVPEEPVASETISVTGENKIKIATMMAKTMYGEGRGLASVTEQASVGWTILNRCDAGYGTIEAIITAEKQFAYSPNFPTVDDYGRDLFALAEDIIARWEREHAGETDVGRVLPKEYLWFRGDGKHNHFRDAYKRPYNVWDWSLESPYEE